MHVHVRACACACACASACASARAYARARACACAGECTCACACVSACASARACTRSRASVRFLRLADHACCPGAKQGSGSCQAMLVFLYEYGVGVQQDPIEGLRWREKLFKNEFWAHEDALHDLKLLKEIVYDRYVFAHIQLVCLLLD